MKKTNKNLALKSIFTALSLSLLSPIALADNNEDAAISLPEEAPLAETSELKQLQEQATQGDAQAQSDLAILYLTGSDVEKNEGKAIEWFTKAAEQGHDKAQNNLGVIYGNGLGVKRDYKKAFEWFSKSAEQGNIGAQETIKQMQERGLI